ncbi:protein kinase [Aquimonas sp.]|uniref:protein kinase domain-containing protein n=1 Tax=Aquimonas sp. TaxID=1872588 RepID=UPI0037BFD52A
MNPASGGQGGMDAERWAALSERLDALLDLPVDARESLLVDLAVDEAEALRGWLRAIEQSAGLLEREPESEGAAAAPDRVGPWRLIAAVGRGGMGEVWRGERTDGAFERAVAIKFLRLDRPQAARSIARERALLARLRHPGIAQLLDGGVSADGRPWLVTEWVEGRGFDAWLREAGPSLRERVALVLALARAAAYAHGQRVLHRDLKPANVRVEPDGSPRLLDFGIGELLEAEPGITREAALTPEFAAPEQLRGEPADVRSDVHALGSLLWFALCERPPHGSDARALAELVERVCQRDAEPPSRHARVDGVDADLDAIALKALARAPQQRYASADALALDIERWLAGDSVAARLPGRAERLYRALRRHPLESALGLALVLALAGGVLVARQETRRADAARLQAEQARDAALAEADRGERLVDTFAGLFAQAGAEQALTANAWLDRARDAALRLVESDAAAGQALLVRLAAVEQDRGEHARALGLLERLDSQSEDLDPALRARAGCRRGSALAMLGREAEAIAVYAAAIVDADALQGSARLARIDCLQGRANLALYRGEAQADELDLAAQALAELDALSASGDLRWRRASLLYTLAALLDLSGRDAEAAQRYGEVMALDEALGTTDSTDHATLIASRAGALQRAGDWAAADADYTRAVALHARLAPEHPNLGSHRANLAGLKALRGDAEGAVAQAEAALAMSNLHAVGRANALYALGQAQAMLAEHAQALASLDAAAQAYIESGQPARALRPRIKQVHVHVLAQQWDAAQALYDTLDAEARDAQPAQRAELLREGVALQHARGDLDAARALAEVLDALALSTPAGHPLRQLVALEQLQLRADAGEPVAAEIERLQATLAKQLASTHPALKPRR